MSNSQQQKASFWWIPLRNVRKWIISICLLVLIYVIMTAEMPAMKSWSYWTMPLSGTTIAIDAGHGGPDGGAVNRIGAIEKDINLAISLHVRDYLQQAGAIVVMTREGDYDLAQPDTKGYARRKAEDLKTRVHTIQSTKANLLVSIHMNSIASKRWSGAQTFYTKQNEDSERLAKLVQAEMQRNLQNTDRVSKPIDRKLYLMNSITIPAALIEVGFLSHAGEGRLLADAKYQHKVAASIYKGILRYMAGEKLGKR
ncbi:N-acetylmuramoyl-L-alanine amidase CwlD [Paenibacillus sp. 481]|uniref:N-acetylmuramoyl-L-alanine amidase CwlD n=1 Tax=Paenibacillus sp. 481 TaxID=2835869 RepID=UPI001E2D52F0|nr:N-acetylmuramoyl-L-alanine amidase CwlD [Paenibacillus sp. 481]UHA71738.1 N-acetylmuramoyl-L-alanine amidase CwlD [Paenibacillus sp. 481]